MTKKTKSARQVLQGEGFVFDLARTSAANAFIMFFGLATGVLTARILGPEGRGDFSMIQMYGTLAAAFCTSGLSAAVIYFSNNDRQKIPVMLCGAVAAATALGLFAALAALLVISLALAGKPGEIREGAVVYLIYIPLATCAALFWASLQAGLEIRLWNRVRLLFTGLWLVPILAVWMFFQISAAQLAMAYLWFVASSVFCFGIVLFRKYGKALLAFDYKITKRIAAYALPTSFATVCNQSNLRIDLILISVIGASLDMGLYVIALSYVSLQSAILSSFLQLMLPKIAGINLHEDKLAVSARLSRMAVPASAAVAVLLCLISPLLIPSLFGSDFKGAIPIALILFGAASAAFANAVLSDCLRGFGFPRRPMIAELLSSLAVAALVLPLYWLWGLLGVALATVFGSVLGFVCLSRYMAKDLHIPYGQFLLLKRDDIHFVAGRLRYLWQHYRA